MTHYKINTGKAVSIKLGSGDEDETGLKGITSVGSGKSKDPELVRLEELLNKLNDFKRPKNNWSRINIIYQGLISKRWHVANGNKRFLDLNKTWRTSKITNYFLDVQRTSKKVHDPQKL